MKSKMTPYDYRKIRRMPYMLVNLINVFERNKVINYIRLKSSYLVLFCMHISSERSNGYFGTKNKGTKYSLGNKL